ncbi:hypothetical protein MmiAt1_13510 [Methanimicrococcus sp. At1]|uniref:GmrSD restriction endonucleases N-terminal domain-containing protein n=1 Tax=Methanimicrococcus hacksteinii TaxID=3028293 RepID=A0ABU3VQS9_9EURY|nr:DUF262 domain-containing protein [Methanimicrococcus sp. At1]MDV0445756.1 hypothetical protein [Methanimicrococcus sp. At1]
MNEQGIETLLSLLEKYDIVIPIIQRDYVQGREDEHAKIVRQNLLSDMKAAILQKTPPLDLNFVYGKVEGNDFIPIDGQQRLTTLFLLHLYAFRNDESKTELFHRFTYKTRISSHAFFEKLTTNRKEIFASLLPPSEEIKDSEWFAPNWKFDPTIESVLIVLDDIKKEFSSIEDLDMKLSNKEYNPIVFKFLDMDDLGMEDTLYIKLNARGKPLTQFENFKASLNAQMRELNIPFTNEFENSFDNEWTDLFWEHSGQNLQDFDQTFLAFFETLFRNHEIIDFHEKDDWELTLDFSRIDEQIFETIYYTLNFLSNHSNKHSEKYSPAYKFIFDALDENNNHKNQVLFHAVSKYLCLSKGTDNGSFKQWLRIIRNIILNSENHTSYNYKNGLIDEIDKLAEQKDKLLEYFSNENVLGFDDQIREEHIKSKIILQDEDFAKTIYEAENHPYFNGQIRSALYLAGNEEEQYDKEIFQHYWMKISELFDAAGPKHDNHLLRRALLTFGDYSTTITGPDRVLAPDKSNEYFSSIKDLFSNCNIFVKELLDNLTSNNSIETQLNTIVKKSAIPETDWRHCFIDYPEIFSYMNQSYLLLRIVNDTVIMSPNKVFNGLNRDVFLSALEQSLKRIGIISLPCSGLGIKCDWYLAARSFKIRFKNKQFQIFNEKDEIIFETSSNTPITEATNNLKFILI